MPDILSNDHGPLDIRHTALYLGGAKEPSTKTTVHGEDEQNIYRIFENVVDSGFDFLTARDAIVPIIAAGIRSERQYRRDSHLQLKALGHDVGRKLFGAIGHQITDKTAATLLDEYVENALKPRVPRVGLELGHIELAGSPYSVDDTWRKLDDLGDRIADISDLDKIDARFIPSKDRSAIFNGVDMNNEEIKLPRARTNFPVVDLGETGIQLFVRVAVGYDSVDRTKPMTLKELREAHQRYMEEHSSDVGITRLDDRIFAYPIAGTLVTLNRNADA